ncbi:class I SAM-dependent methyltransferase [Providencia rettgeri]|uniref:class I SAM-dependent methyltransferase n=1 Tax=Providencia sp. TaxID=589 RepID=UPI0024AA3BB7|nr:methyltransferase [Providencia rettgeri]
MRIMLLQLFGTYKLYIEQFITSPKEMGTLLPSSRSLCDAMLTHIDWDQHTQIAEIGAGNGVITKHILQKCAVNTSLNIYEINETFITQLQQINDSRVIINPVSAEHLFGEFHVVISGIPFLSLETKTSMRILKKVSECLAQKQGIFVLFQYTQACEPMFERYFDFTKERVYLNFPPAWIYICQPKC